MSTTQQAHVEGDGNIVVQAVGDDITVNINGRPYLELTTYPSRRRPARTELDLLDPFRRAIELAGRDTELKTLWDWLHDEPPIAARVVTGGAGAGKTRLAVELVERLRVERPGQWHAGFVTAKELLRFAEAGSLSGWGWQKPTLVLVDYAATLVTAINQWLHDLAENHRANGHPLRLLLLEREASPEQGWLRALLDDSWSGQGVRELLNPLDPLRLAPVAAVPGRAILTTTLAKASALLGVPAPSLPAPGTDPVLDQHLAQPLWTEPLHLMMAALVAVGSRLPLVEVLSLSRTDLATRLAQRELARLRRFAGGEGSAKATLLAFGGVAATLCGGLDRKELIEVLGEAKARLHLACPDGEAGLADQLEDALPRPNGGIAPILPDMIGEAALLSTYDSRGKARLDAEWVLRLAQGHPREVVAATIRTIQDFAATDETPLGWIDGLIQSGCADSPSLLSEIEGCLPKQTLALRERAAEVTDALLRRIDVLIDRSATWAESLLPEKARLLNDLAIRLSYLGRREEAVVRVQEAIRIRRRLAVAQPAVFLGSWAGSLANLAAMLRDLGRTEEALAAAKTAADVLENLAASRQNTCMSVFTKALNNLANVWSSLGQRQEALSAARLAVSLTRDLHSANPDDFLPDLARSLNNLALRLSEVGRREEALTTAKEAARIYRQLAVARPDAFLPEMAGALHNLANALGDLGKREEALMNAEEAVRIREHLAALRPLVFLPDLAGSLTNLANRLGELGHWEAASKKAEEAVRLYRQLTAVRPEAYQPDLASSLINLSNQLGALGRREAAWAKVEEASQIYEALATARPRAFLPGFGLALHNLSNRLSDLGRKEEALTRAEEAVRIRRGLAQEQPAAFLPCLASSLNNLALRLNALGRQAEGLRRAEEALHIRRRLATGRPDAFLPDLAGSLNTLANMLSNVERGEEALAKVEEALRIREQLAAARPDAFLPHLARSLEVKGRVLSGLRRHAEAVASFHAGIAALEKPFRQLPPAHAPLMGALCQAYQAAAAACGAQPDMELLGPVAEIFQRLRQTSKPE